MGNCTIDGKKLFALNNKPHGIKYYAQKFASSKLFNSFHLRFLNPASIRGVYIKDTANECITDKRV